MSIRACSCLVVKQPKFEGSKQVLAKSYCCWSVASCQYEYVQPIVLLPLYCVHYSYSECLLVAVVLVDVALSELDTLRYNQDFDVEMRWTATSKCLSTYGGMTAVDEYSTSQHDLITFLSSFVAFVALL